MTCNYIANTCTGETQCTCITMASYLDAMCNDVAPYPDMSQYCAYEPDCVWDEDNYKCISKNTFCVGEDN